MSIQEFFKIQRKILLEIKIWYILKELNSEKFSSKKSFSENYYSIISIKKKVSQLKKKN